MRNDSSYYSPIELEQLNFKSLGENVLLSKKASFYNSENIEIGDHSRIDDFSVLSGRISLGKCVHVTPHCILSGGRGGIRIGDYCALAYRVQIFAESDDYTGETLFSSLIPEELKDVYRSEVRIHNYCIIGAGSTIFPGVTLGEGAAVGAMSLVNSNIPPWTIAYGIPARNIRKRSKKMLDLLHFLNPK